ncbi:hypothetical protein ACFP1Z_12020 [Streptomyces gamaensis]|uniref:Ig-like domain-containing protein n=1 Tax=Streptomyces gamaensis TaxID=1763542 RepID=A0ABW0YZP3_9ACTN
MMHGIAKRLGTWAGSAALVGAAVLTGPAAGQAHAAAGDLACSGQFTMTFTPGLTPGGSATLNVSASLSKCSSPNGYYSTLQSATATASGTATSNSNGKGPCGVLFSGSGTGTLTWSPANTKSSIQFTVNTDPTNGTVTFHCVITNGTLVNDSDAVAPAISGMRCSTNGGLQSLSATVGVAFS